MSELRVGIGVDAHAFEDGVPLVLGGVAIAHPRGLAGHSDGDVIAHALIDAVLGAAGLGDIGSLFPSGDDRWHGADSLDLLRDAYAQVRDAGYGLVNADCVLIGEEPRIALHREEMRHRLAAALGVEPERMNVRATTTDRLGFTGRGEGLAAQAVALLEASVNLVRYADRPDLLEIRFERLSQVTFPEYMHNNTPGNLYWGRLYTDFPDFQVGLLDGDALVAEAHALPVPWDGTVEGLPSGWDEGFVQGMTSGLEPGALMALAISVLPGRQGQQLSSRMIQAFRDTARAAGLASVLAPVRPTWKERYPLIPIEEYMTWRRKDGEHFDPWLRIHERVGGVLLAAAPRSMVMEAPVADWEEWTEMRFPADGEYVFPGALATLVVEGGVGRHVEPNVWVLHRS